MFSTGYGSMDENSFKTKVFIHIAAFESDLTFSVYIRENFSNFDAAEKIVLRIKEHIKNHSEKIMRRLELETEIKTAIYVDRIANPGLVRRFIGILLSGLTPGRRRI